MNNSAPKSREQQVYASAKLVFQRRSLPFVLSLRQFDPVPDSDLYRLGCVMCLQYGVKTCFVTVARPGVLGGWCVLPLARS